MSNGGTMGHHGSSIVAILGLTVLGWGGLALTPGPSTAPPRAGTAAGVTGTDSRLGGSAVDRTPPRLRPEARPATGRPGQPVALHANARDVGSGVAAQACHLGRLPRAGQPGLHTVTCWARDRAGNLATARTTYVVVGERWQEAGPARVAASAPDRAPRRDRVARRALVDDRAGWGHERPHRSCLPVRGWQHAP